MAILHLQLQPRPQGPPSANINVSTPHSQSHLHLLSANITDSTPLITGCNFPQWLCCSQLQWLPRCSCPHQLFKHNTISTILFP